MNIIEIKDSGNMSVVEVMAFIRKNRLCHYMVWNPLNTQEIHFQSVSDLDRAIKPLAENGAHFRSK